MEENVMNDSIQTAAIMSAGMKLLRENLGLIESEIFIYNLKQERFDYTEWRQDLYEDMPLEELLSKAVAFQREHPELIPKDVKII
jgi:hypothetical protein